MIDCDHPLDYVENLAHAPVLYPDGRAVGSIACADGGQAAELTLAAMRPINSLETRVTDDGCSDPAVAMVARPTRVYPVTTAWN